MDSVPWLDWVGLVLLMIMRNGLNLSFVLKNLDYEEIGR